MAETLRTDTDSTLLTRREVRRFFRVNERTIDRWMDRGLLMQVGEIPAAADSPARPVFLVRDDKLVQKLHARFEQLDEVELDADRLPSKARKKLTRQATQEEPEQAVAEPEPELEPETEPELELEPDPEPELEPDPEPELEPDAEPEAEPEAESKPRSESRPKPRARARAKVKVKPSSEAGSEPTSSVPTAEAEARKKRTWTITRSSSPRTSQVRTRVRTRTGQAPVESSSVDEQGRFATLQAAAEASAYPKLAEALWDDETLGALQNAAETLSAEADRLSKGGQLSPVAMDSASSELEMDGIDLEEEEDRGPQVIDEEQALETWSVYGGDDAAKERLLLQAELAEVKSMQQANLERMEARLGNIENLVEDLGLARADELNIEATLEEIRGHVVVNDTRRDILATSLSTITDSVQELRTYIATANKTALATARSVRELSKKTGLHSTARAGGRGPMNRHGKVAPVLVLGVGILVLTWTLALYLKTGNFYVALAGVVLANLSACATILLGRSENN